MIRNIMHYSRDNIYLPIMWANMRCGLRAEGAMGRDSIATVNAMYYFLSNNLNIPFVTTVNVP